MRMAWFVLLFMTVVAPGMCRQNTVGLLPITALHRPASAQNQPATAIRVSVNRVDVGVIVTDARGNFVEGLGRRDFHVFDNDIKQPLTDFAAVSGPATLLLLLEAGPAVYLLEGGHRNAAYALLQHLAEQDTVAVATYAEALSLALPFTTDKQLASATISDLHFNLGFASLNLSSSLAQALAGVEKLPGKKSIVLLSTGFDTSPTASVAALEQKLRVSGVRIFTVSLNGELRSPISPDTSHQSKKGKAAQQSEKAHRDKAVFAEGEFTRADAFLSQIAEMTGGRAFFPRTAAQFAAAYAQIAEQVRHEYSLAFAPPAHDGQLHKIRAEVNNSASAPSSSAALRPYRLAHRQAYLAPSQ